MKKILIVLALSFTSSLFADDILDFQIDGMSIGDSLLDFYSLAEIESWNKDYYAKSNKFVRISSDFLSNNKFEMFKL